MAVGKQTFLNMARGHRLTNYAGIQHEDPNWVPKYSRDYTYLELPAVDPGIDEDGKEITKYLRNQTHCISAPVSAKPARGYKLLVTVNPELHEYADAPSVLVLHHEGSHEQAVEIWARFRKDMPVGKLHWMFRISLME
jgi:hypothetical protein